MLTDQFISICYQIITTEDKKIVKKDAIKDILEIISFCTKNEKIDIPINIKNKVDCLKTICELRIEGKTLNDSIDSISFSNKFEQLIEYIKVKIEEVKDKDEILSNIKQVRLRKKFIDLLPNYDKIQKFMEVAKNNSFNSLDQYVQEYENITTEMYTTMMSSNRQEYVEKCSSLDMVNDNYESAVELIKQKYDRKNTLPTGIPVFDNEIFNGGYARSRLYMFGGGQGTGKSIFLLNNLLCQATGTRIDGVSIPFLNSYKETEKEVLLFITLENQIDETLLRAYQCLHLKQEVTALRDMSSGINIKNEITKKIRKDVIPIIKFFPKYSIGALDITNIIHDIENQYGKGCVRVLYVDYLDLLKSDIKTDIYRLELGYISSALKDIAVEFNIPVITPSQLNKTIFEVQASSFNLGMISESMKKVDVSDFIAMMIKDRNDDLIHMRVGKNRSGPSEISLDMKVNFPCYKLQNVYRVTVANPGQSRDSMSDQNKFDGLQKLEESKKTNIIFATKNEI